MTRSFYLIPFFLFALSADHISGQDDYSASNEGRKLLSCHVGIGDGIRYELRLENFFEENWSLFYSLGININNPSNFSEIRPPLGVSVGTAMLVAVGCTSLYGNGDLISGAFLAACVIPDGVAYHQKLNDKFAISPYISWTGINARLSDTDGSWQFSYSPKAGLRFMMNLNDRVMFSFEETIQYRASDHFEFYPGFNAMVKF